MGNAFVRRFATVFQAPLPAKMTLAHGLFRRAITQMLYRIYLKSLGKKTVIYKPSLIVGLDKIAIGEATVIRYGSRLEIVEHGQTWVPELRIGDNVNIEQNVHIICHDRVTIGNDVSITGHCAIVDVTHPHNAMGKGPKTGKLIDQKRSFVEIGDGTFIGFGSTVLPNVRIGRNCMIGAGSVVTSDVPDGAVVGGVPARILSIASPPNSMEMSA